MKIHLERFERAEIFETLTQIVQALICDFATADIMLIISDKNNTYSLKISLMDSKELSFCKPSLRAITP